MLTTPKSLRLQIGLFGRTNVGKSSFLNFVAGQDVSIISEIPGTTTDIVEKTMELLPVGPVVFLDTAGFGDESELGELRINKTKKIFDRADIVILMAVADEWGVYEHEIVKQAQQRNTPLCVVINKVDFKCPDKTFLEKIKFPYLLWSCKDISNKEKYISEFKNIVLTLCPEEFLTPRALIGDLMKPKGIALLIVPIDMEAPKGRIILPQVQTIRDALDNDCAALVVKESEYKYILTCLSKKPDLVICDSQVVDKMVKDTPEDIKCTTFSILFARYKGDLLEMVNGAKELKKLKAGDKILVAESCSHHPIEDDIGRVKLPKWLRKYVGGDVIIDTYAGRDFPENLKDYKLIIQCGGCMMTRKEMLLRIKKAKDSGVPITNYGVCISYIHGVLKRVLSPFPAELQEL